VEASDDADVGTQVSKSFSTRIVVLLRSFAFHVYPSRARVIAVPFIKVACAAA
jgi:hypothetical protein